MSVCEPLLHVVGDQKERPARSCHREARAHALPYEIRLNGASTGRFEDLRDAAASARIAKGAQPDATVVIVDAKTRRLIIEIVA
jgi:hypothetical protein